MHLINRVSVDFMHFVMYFLSFGITVNMIANCYKTTMDFISNFIFEGKFLK